MTGIVVWLTGLPASGKSTLAARTADACRDLGQPVLILDEDAVREALQLSPSSEQGAPRAFFRSLANLAASFARQGLVVLVAAATPEASSCDLARGIADRFLLVHVDTPRALCRRRDSKGTYAEGPVVDEPPASPDLRARGGFDDEAVAAILAACRASTASPLRVVPDA